MPLTTILSAPKLLSFFPPTATTSMMSEGIEYVHRYDVHEGLSSASQPPDHDGGNVGNCDHHCGDHGLIEKSDGRGSARGIVQSAIRLCVD